MSTLGGLLGLNGGSQGTGVAAPSMAQIYNPVTGNQIAGSYQGAQNSLQSQQALLAALQNQNGIGNQSQVYNQLQGVANGTGPNPAQAMLANATGANVANQADLMAGQRGTGANAGLLARQASQQGAGLQQQAAGQGAALQAQQSLGALGQAGSMANQQVSNQIGATGMGTSANLAEQQALLNAQQGVNQANVSAQGSVNAANAGMAQQQAGAGNKLLGGLLGGVGAAFPAYTAAANVLGGASGMAHGGEVKGPKSRQGMKLHGGGKVPAMVSPGESYLSPVQAEEAAGDVNKTRDELRNALQFAGKPKVAGDSKKNDTVPAALEPGGVVIPRSKQLPADAARFIEAALSKKGKK